MSEMMPISYYSTNTAVPFCEQVDNRELPSDDSKTKRACAMLWWLESVWHSHKIPQYILELLDLHGAMNVTEIYKSLDIEQSVGSAQLGRLHDAGMVDLFEVGQFHYYMLNRKRTARIFEIVKELSDGIKSIVA